MVQLFFNPVNTCGARHLLKMLDIMNDDGKTILECSYTYQNV